MIRVLFVCHGNICRSTMAQSILADMVEKKGISSQFYIESAATSREEIGNPPHRGTREKLRREKIPLIPHRAVQMTRGDYQYYDYLIGMDSENIYYMKRIAGGDPDHKISKLLSYAGYDSDVADPWYTGNFEVTYDDIVQGCEALLKYLGF